MLNLPEHDAAVDYSRGRSSSWTGAFLFRANSAVCTVSRTLCTTLSRRVCYLLTAPSLCN
jgi:hypothetical protein